MAIDANSYSSVADVEAMCRHLLDGHASFTTATNPTTLEVEAFIDDVSSLLNDAIAAAGFTVPISAASPKRSCDIYVRTKVVALCELTQRGEGFGEEEGSRYNAFWKLLGDASEWVAERAQGWVNQGISPAVNASSGLNFTALNKHSERDDPMSSTLEQPLFRRHKWDNV